MISKRTILPLLLLGIFSQAFANDKIEEYKSIIKTSQDRGLKIEAYLQLIEILSWDEPDTTIFYANQFVREYGTVAINKIKADYYTGVAYRSKGDWETAIQHFNVSYQASIDLPSMIDKAHAGYQLGILNLYRGNREASLEYLLESYEIYEDEGSKEDLAAIQNALGNYYADDDQLELALERYDKALEIYREIEDFEGQANINANLALRYIDSGEYEKAEMHLDRQGKILESTDSDYSKGFYYDFKGYLYEEQGMYDKALVWYYKALEIRKTQDSHYNICESNLGIASALAQLDRCAGAISYLEDVFSYSEEHQSLTQEQRAHQLLSECYEKTGNYALALNHQKEFKNLSDSIYQKEKIEEFAQKEKEFQKSEMDKEISLLAMNNELQESQLKQQRAYVYTGWIGALLFLIFSGFIYKLYRSLQSKNKMISYALEEKEILLREIHHRVKNNLQVISSLLSLQSRKSQDINIKKAIDEGRNRVQSMALIHQNLYQRDNLTGIGVKSYLVKLINTLFDTYNISEDNIKLSFDVADLELDVDSMIPIGLIMNELVTNCLKHAFANKEDGNINISLKEENDKLVLAVKDDGVGVSKEKLFSQDSFGNRLIVAFSQKLKAEMLVENNNGTEIIMNISKYKKAS